MESSVEREGERGVSQRQGQEMLVGLTVGTSLGREETRTRASILRAGWYGVGAWAKNQNFTKPLSANYFAPNFSIQRIICNFVKIIFKHT